MFGLVACQTEPVGLDVEVGGDVEKTIAVSISDSETRAGLDALNAILENDDAILRYVLAIYDENNEPTDYREVKYCDDTSTAFDVRLAPNRKYTFVVWADIVPCEGYGDYHYNTANLTNVTIIDTEEHPWKAMDETREAFTGAATEDSYSSASVINVKLTRPFAKLQVKTTDLGDLELLGITPAKATIEYTSELCVAFNAFKGCAIASGDVAKKHTVDYPADAFEGGNTTLFTDYLFANTEAGAVHFTMDVMQDSGRRIKYNNFNTDIPIKRNCLTTISGNLLTDGTKVSVDIEETEEEKEWPSTMAEQLAFVGIVGGEVTLTEDVVLSAPVVINPGVNAVINLNGHEIINTTESDEYGEGEAIISYGTLTIKGEGTVKGTTRAVWARGDGGKAVVNIDGGIFQGCADGYAKGGCSVIYASSGNTVNIYGGRFEALAADKTSYADKDNGVYAALNIQDNNGIINVMGGTFVKFNPAAPGTEPAAWNKEHPNGFVDEAYVSKKVKVGLTYNYEVQKATIVNGKDDLIDFIKQNTAGNDVYYITSGVYKLGDDVDLGLRIDIQPGNDVLLDLNGKTITSSADYVILVREGATLTIDGDGTIETETPAPIMFYPAGNLVIENGTFIRHIPEGYTGNVGSMFVGTKPAGGWESTGVTINGGYFDSGYYPAILKNVDIEMLISGGATLEETATDIAKRGQPGDSNVIRTALKELVSVAFNRSNNYFEVYGGTFVGANPAWGDEGCMLPTKPNYLRPWSYYQGAFIDGQEFNEDGIVLPEGFAITKGTHEDGRPTYTVTYNK